MNRLPHLSVLINDNNSKIKKGAPSSGISTMANNKTNEGLDFKTLTSQYTPLFQEEEHSLEVVLSELELQKQHREQELNNRLAEIWRDAAVIEEKIQDESKEAAAASHILQDMYAQRFAELGAVLTMEIRQIFDHFDKEVIPLESDRIEDTRVHLEELFEVAVPKSITQQSGRVERELRRSHDIFEIDKHKTIKREAMVVEAANEHINTTAQRFHDETAMQRAVISLLEEDIITTERREAMLEIPRQRIATAAVLETRQSIDQEADIREREDTELLDAIVETQGLLQKTILEHFGSEERGTTVAHNNDNCADAADVDISFPALTRLTSKLENRKSNVIVHGK